MLEASSLCFAYRNFRMENLSISIGKGTFVCIAGPNGSGKSTLARLLGGVLEPKSGTITSDGLVVFAGSNPDNGFVNPVVEDDVAFGPENLGLTQEQIRQAVDTALDTVKMSGFAKRAVSMLSYGEKQKISLSGVLAMKPDYLILDEVSSMLDSDSSARMTALLRDLADRGTAVVLVTHNMEEAAYADRLVAMKDGQIEADCKPWEILTNKELTSKLSLRQPLAVRLADALRAKGCKIDITAVTKEALEKEVRRCVM